MEPRIQYARTNDDTCTVHPVEACSPLALCAGEAKLYYHHGRHAERVRAERPAGRDADDGPPDPREP